MNPNDGSILAMASSPTYEPSVYAGRVTLKALNSEGLTEKTAANKNFPAINRAVQATYPPGSVFKPVTALAALEEHLVSPYATLACTGTYTAPEDRSHRTFHNWDPNVNQQMDLPTALGYSCDTYFYQLGNDFYELPSDRGQPLQKWAKIFGFGAGHRDGCGAGGAGSRPDDRLAAPARSRERPIPMPGRSIASGSRATRSSWRSARATCSSRRCRWRASTR